MSVPLPEVDGGLCLHVTPEDALAFPMRCGDDVYRAWRFVIGAARWQLQESSGAVGDPLMRPDREEVSA